MLSCELKAPSIHKLALGLWLSNFTFTVRLFQLQVAFTLSTFPFNFYLVTLRFKIIASSVHLGNYSWTHEKILNGTNMRNLKLSLLCAMMMMRG